MSPETERRPFNLAFLTQEQSNILSQVLMEHTQLPNKRGYFIYGKHIPIDDFPLDVDFIYYPKIDKTRNIVKERFLILEKPLGKGNFGEVRRVKGALYPDGQGNVNFVLYHKHVLKLSTVDDFEQEAKLGKMTPHLKSKSPIQAMNLYGDDISYMLIREMKGKTLRNIINEDNNGTRYLSPEERLEISIKIAQALYEQIHLRGLIHFDIKPENIMVDLENDNGITVNILDVGLSIKTGNTDKWVRGTPGYTAPEVSITPKAATQQADVFSAGVTLSELWHDKVMPDESINSIIVNMIHSSPTERDTPPKIVSNLQAILVKEKIKALEKDLNTKLDENIAFGFKEMVDMATQLRFLFAANTLSPEQIIAEINNKLEKIPDNSLLIQEFLTTLQIPALMGAKSKNEIKERMELISDGLNTHFQNLNRINFSIKLIKLLMPLVNAVEAENIKNSIISAEQDAEHLAKKLNKSKNSGDLTYVAESNRNPKLTQLMKSIFSALIPLNEKLFNHEKLQEIMGILKLLAPQPEVNELTKLQNAIKATIFQYIEKTLTPKNLSKSDRAASKPRQHDMRLILQLLDKSNDVDSLTQSIQQYLSTPETNAGLFQSKGELKTSLASTMKSMTVKQPLRSITIKSGG